MGLFSPHQQPSLLPSFRLRLLAQLMREHHLLHQRHLGYQAANSSGLAAETASAEAILPSATKTERFLLTAADQESGSRDERLNRVIRSKYEAGLLKPYNYVKGYARLSRWMDRKYVLTY